MDARTLAGKTLRASRIWTKNDRSMQSAESPVWT